MSEKQKATPSLIELINSQTTYEDLRIIIQDLITEEDEQILGEKETSSQIIAESIAYSGAFVPHLATFGQEDYFAILSPDLTRDKQLRVWEINVKLGVIQPDFRNQGEIRGTISSELSNIINNQFLSDDE